MNKTIGWFLVLALCIALPLSAEEQAPALERVVIGSSPVISSSGIFIAIERGYFAAEGIEPDTTTFTSSGAQLLPSLIRGDLDVGGGNINSGLYNAFNDGHQIRIVADKGTVSKDKGYLALVAAKKNVPDGDPTKFKIEKGYTMAVTARGVSQEIVTERWVQHYGLELSDIKLVTMPYGAFVPALANGSLDATVEIEPHVARAVATGAAIRIAGDDVVYPDQQSAAIFFSENFATKKKDLAQRWMNAYIRGLRDYNDAFVYGKDFDEIVKILIKWTSVKEPDLYKQMWPVGLDPNGMMNLQSLRDDAKWLHEKGYIKDPPQVDGIVDTSFIEEAGKKLAHYQPPTDK